jgi:hypothetical protein
MRSDMHRSALALTALILLLSAAGFSGSSAADEVTVLREAQLKSGYLLNFMKFVDWPAAAPTEPLTICFLGAVSMRETLEVGIQSKRVGTRPLAVRQIEDAGKTDGCNVLYTDATRVSTASFATRELLPILTVSDGKEFAHNGGIIELFTEANRLRFIINVDNAHRAGLHISASLLQLAAVVDQNKPP